MFGYGISTLAWGIAPVWEWGLLPLLFAFGFSEAAWIATETLQTEITTRDTRTSVFGVITTVTGVVGGMGPTLGAWLIVLGGNPMPFLAAGVSGLLAMAAILPLRGGKVRVQLPQAALQAE
jgi:MFS family permease